MARDQLGIQIITPVYFGSRNVNLKPDKTIKTPADMAGIKLRMPPGEFWQFLGESIGANPTPVAYAELYTALQTGTIDGQDNPLVASKLMKFDEVTTQFVLTRHVIGYDVMAISAKIWDAMKPASRRSSRPPPTRRSTTTPPSSTRRRRRSLEYFKKEGKKVYDAGLRTPSAPSRRSATSTSTAATGRRARSSASTRSNSADRKPAATRNGGRSAAVSRPPRNGHP